MWLQLLGSAATQLVMNAPAGSAFVPGSSNSYDLGGGSNLWRNIYAGGTLTAAVGSFSGNVTTSGGSFTCSSANCGLTMGGGTTSYVSGSGTGDMWLQGPTNVTVNASNSFVPANDNATKLGIPGQAWQSVALSNSGQIFLGTVSGAVLWGDSGGAIHLGAGGSGSILISTAAGAGMLPYGDNTTILGSGSNRWSVVYAANGTIQTSDAREKDNIKDSDLGLDFINQLHPVSFIWKQHPGKTPDTHRHYGLLAQEMDEELAGRDFGGLKAPANDNERYGLNYDELIGPLIKAVQQLSQENHILKVRLDRLEHERIAPGRRASND
jgi:hypothetical protein